MERILGNTRHVFPLRHIELIFVCSHFCVFKLHNTRVKKGQMLKGIYSIRLEFISKIKLYSIYSFSKNHQKQNRQNGIRIYPVSPNSLSNALCLSLKNILGTFLPIWMVTRVCKLKEYMVNIYSEHFHDIKLVCSSGKL